MKISTFKDGSRLIVVFEGIDLSEEALIKGMLSPISTDRVPVVEPIEEEPEEMPEIPVFTDGPYAGLTPTDVLMAEPREAQEAFLYITQNAVPEELKSACDVAVKEYLRSRFSSTDEAEYAKKLTERQVERFFEMFKPVIPEDLYTGKRDDVQNIIRSFKN